MAVASLAAAVVAVAAAVALDRLVADSEYEQADSRLAAELSAAVTAADALGVEAREQAVSLARDPAVQRALVDRDDRRLAQLAERGVSFEAGGRRVAGSSGSPLRFRAAVVSRGAQVGRVVVGVPLAAVEERTPLSEGGRLIWAVAISNGKVTYAGERYRALATRNGALRLAVLTPLAPIEAAIAVRQERVRWAVLATFVAFVLIATLVAQLSRPVARPLRRSIDEPPGRRGRRSRAAATLVGNALAAGHDRDALLPVILDSAVAVTGASGARLVADGVELARSGSTGVGRPPLVFALSAGSGQEAQLVLEPPARGDFDDEAVQLAEWLAGRASVALQNAHLHVMARRLASTDELTQLGESAPLRRSAPCRGRSVRSASATRSPSWSRTSTTSRRSTTGTGTTPGTSCCRPSPT